MGYFVPRRELSASSRDLQRRWNGWGLPPGLFTTTPRSPSPAIRLRTWLQRVPARQNCKLPALHAVPSPRVFRFNGGGKAAVDAHFRTYFNQSETSLERSGRPTGASDVDFAPTAPQGPRRPGHLVQHQDHRPPGQFGNRRRTGSPIRTLVSSFCSRAMWAVRWRRIPRLSYAHPSRTWCSERSPIPPTRFRGPSDFDLLDQ